MCSKIRPIVLSGPSGGGKSTILKRAMESYKNCFAFSVSRKFLNGFIYGSIIKLRSEFLKGELYIIFPKETDI